MKRKEKQEATLLRKRGFSMREISEKLGVSKSTASLWVRDIPLSKRAKDILSKKYTEGHKASQKTHREKTNAKLAAAHIHAVRTVKYASTDKYTQRVVCAMLYWCEGKKSRNDSEFLFTNSDPDLVAAFLRLFRENFSVDEKKFRVCVHLHEYHNTQRQLQFWSKVTTIPLSNFIKPYRKAHTGKRTREGYQGCASVRYHDANMAREIQAIARSYMGSSVNW